MKTIPQFALSNVLLAGFTAGLLSGCSANFVSSPAGLEKVPIGNIQGVVYGGQAPVGGARIYVYAAGTGRDGGAATSLIQAESSTYEDGSGNYYVKTDGNGNFALAGDYTCTAGTQVYMVAVGSDPGPSGMANSGAAVQMAGLGQCPAVGSLAAEVPYLVITEATTVAFAMSHKPANTMPVLYNSAASQPGSSGDGQILSGPYNIAFDVNAVGSVQLVRLAAPVGRAFYDGMTLSTGPGKKQAITTTNGNPGSKL